MIPNRLKNIYVTSTPATSVIRYGTVREVDRLLVMGASGRIVLRSVRIVLRMVIIVCSSFEPSLLPSHHSKTDSDHQHPKDDKDRQDIRPITFDLTI